MLADGPEAWSVSEVAQWLGWMGLGVFGPSFRRHRITGEDLLRKSCHVALPGTSFRVWMVWLGWAPWTGTRRPRSTALYHTLAFAFAFYRYMCAVCAVMARGELWL